MRIYEVRKGDSIENDQTVGFARSFDQARDIVREDDPAAKKTKGFLQGFRGNNHGGTQYSNGMVIFAIDIKPDKEGIISKLNSLLEESSQSSQVDPDPEPVPQPVQEVVAPVSDPAADVGCPGIVPAIAYSGTGKGTCLHCKKEVGYVGGFPRVDPPAAICD